jgi:glutaredoxin
MYFASRCPDCNRARAWLEARNIDYTAVDVNSVPGAAARVRHLASGNLVTPSFDIQKTIVIDFDQDKLEELLGWDPTGTLPTCPNPPR